MTEKCYACRKVVVPDTRGECPDCRRQLVDIPKGRDEELQFYCVVCEEFFFACRDDTGYDQAPCPKCGDLSNTPDFHVDSKRRSEHERLSTWGWVTWLFIFLFVTSGIGWGFIRMILVP